jgi:hypothetical protein
VRSAIDAYRRELLAGRVPACPPSGAGQRRLPASPPAAMHRRRCASAVACGGDGASVHLFTLAHGAATRAARQGHATRRQVFPQPKICRTAEPTLSWCRVPFPRCCSANALTAGGLDRGSRRRSSGQPLLRVAIDLALGLAQPLPPKRGQCRWSKHEARRGSRTRARASQRSRKAALSAPRRCTSPVSAVADCSRCATRARSRKRSSSCQRKPQRYGRQQCASGHKPAAPHQALHRVLQRLHLRLPLSTRAPSRERLPTRLGLSKHSPLLRGGWPRLPPAEQRPADACAATTT